MRIDGATLLVTGANRGIGRALVQDALGRGAARVYAGTRSSWTHPDPRVTPLFLDVTDSPQIRRAAEQIDSLDILINNAGVAIYDDLSDPDLIERHFAVNLLGTHRVTQTLLPSLTRARGAVVNNLSVNAFAPLPLIPAYSISKAAAFSMTQSLRALLADRGVSVHAVLTGIVDTDMSRDVDIPKASAASVARAILDGVANGEEDIFPIPWRPRWPTPGTTGQPRHSNASTRPCSVRHGPGRAEPQPPPSRRSPRRRKAGRRGG